MYLPLVREDRKHNIDIKPKSKEFGAFSIFDNLKFLYSFMVVLDFIIYTLFTSK